MLFRLKDATLYDVNAPEWDRLFVQGVGSYLLGFGGKLLCIVFANAIDACV